MSTLEPLVALRVIGCALALVAHFTMAWGRPRLGVAISLAGQFFFLPWAIAHHAWDMALLDGSYVVINLSRLLAP